MVTVTVRETQTQQALPRAGRDLDSLNRRGGAAAVGVGDSDGPRRSL